MRLVRNLSFRPPDGMTARIDHVVSEKNKGAGMENFNGFSRSNVLREAVIVGLPIVEAKMYAQKNSR